MQIKQISTIINAASREIWGVDAPSVKDTSDMISLGNKVFASDTDKDRFLGVLVDRIKRTVIRTLDLSVDMPNLLLDAEAYFGIMQKINVQPIATVNDNSWNIGEVNYQPTIWDIHKPSVSQKLFHNVDTFTIPITIPDVMYKSAFDDGKMGEFIQGIFSTIESCLIMYVNALNHLVVCSAIAEKIKSGKATNVLAIYNTEHPDATLTAEEFLNSPDLLRYSGMVARNKIKFMGEPSVLFNEEGMVRATARDNMHVLALSSFVSAYETVYESSVFNRFLTELPLYNEVTYWQNMGQNPSFATTSSINIIPPSEADEDTPTAVTASGVFMVIADRQAMGTSLIEDWSGSDRNNRERYTNYTYGVNRGIFLDLSENIEVLYVAD